MSSSASSTPDIASLSLSSNPSHQRVHDSYDYEGNGVNSGARSQYHYSTSPPIPAQSQYNPLTLNQSPLKNKTMRGGLPSQWLENPIPTPDNRSLSPNNNSDFSSTGGSPPASQINAPTTPVQGNDDEVIPTAIVIKNIPFNVKRETLLDIIASLSIPTPYAFNYHLDQSGQFRGLAFANFRASSDADAVVAALNGFDVQGRKLRVEYKKVLQAGEKERIEREKAIRRMRSMQLEKEQHQQQQQQAVSSMPAYDDFGPVIPPAFTPQRSFSAQYASQQQQYSPPQLAAIPGLSPPFINTSVQQLQSMMSPLPASPAVKSPSNELDLNDPSTLDIYSRILLFKDDHMRDELAFSRTLTPKQRRVVHLIAQKLGVYHYSVGEGDERYAVVTRIDPAPRQQPRQTLSRTPSAYLTPTNTTQMNLLRGKKSMPDMKSLQNPVPRLNTRSSNGNIREGYATIASPSRRSPGGFGSLFNTGFGSGSIPPVPSLPSAVQNGIAESPTIMRQPRGPGVGGFESRRERVTASESQAIRGVDARSHEPLEI